jgi:hypothetical protein
MVSEVGQSLPSAGLRYKKEVEMGEFSTTENADARLPSQSTTMDFESHASASKGLGFHGDIESNSSSAERAATASSDGAQAGVKNIEAVAMTWTKWGLIAAYARLV